MSYRIVPAGDSTLVVEFEDRIDAEVNRQAVALAVAIDRAALPGVRDIVPSYRSVAIYFDPLRTDVDRLAAYVHIGSRSSEAPSPAVKPIRVPVCYGGAFGPDLAEVASFAGLSESAAADLHAGATYRVFMLGFLPGFAYMGPLSDRIAAPRRTTPRLRVPAGSVGIAGPQTGIYPSESPGGWQLIGRTPVKPFDPGRAEPFLFAAGDTIQFYRIDPAEFECAAVA